MKSRKLQMELLADLGSRWAILLRNGRYLEGYILEIEDLRFEFGQGGPLADDKTEWILIDDVDFAKAAYWDRALCRYFDVVWDERNFSWVKVS